MVKHCFGYFFSKLDHFPVSAARFGKIHLDHLFQFCCFPEIAEVSPIQNSGAIIAWRSNGQGSSLLERTVWKLSKPLADHEEWQNGSMLLLRESSPIGTSLREPVELPS